MPMPPSVQLAPDETRLGMLRSQGAEFLDPGVRYRTWADKSQAQVVIYSAEGTPIRTVTLSPEGEGYFHGFDPEGRAGDLYCYNFGGERSFPDPASRWQPFGVHGPSIVIDPNSFAWSDLGFSAPPLADLVIYELHIGTFTAEGTFAAAAQKLGHVAALGATAIEVMPIADFAGKRNWGYDGVSLYAPCRAYGHPDELRALVDAAHRLGLAVILDVVYNHLGPDGNYAGAYHSGYFNPRHKTPWGDALRFEEPAVRRFFVENAPYWRREFHIDGFRLDATHAIADTSPAHVLAELTNAIHRCGGFAIAEDDRRMFQVIQPSNRGGLGFDACWADDFHHAIHVMLTREQEGYYHKYSGDAAELARTLAHNWLSDETPNSSDEPPASRFVFTISNHDQVGNRAFGERLGHLTSAAAYRAASALLCFAPQIPLLFMGQEWNSSSPFRFFTDHNVELGKAVTNGRRCEFRHFSAFADPAARENIPDPQAEATFATSKLDWTEVDQAGHGQILDLYVECLRLRRAYKDTIQKGRFATRVLGPGAVAILFTGDECSLLVVANLTGDNPAVAELAGESPEGWHRILSTNEQRFGGSADSADLTTQTEIFVRQS